MQSYELSCIDIFINTIIVLSIIIQLTDVNNSFKHRSCL